MLPIGYWRGTYASAGIGSRETDWMVLLNNYLAGGGDTYAKLARSTSQGGRNNEMLGMFRDPNATFPDDGIHHYIGHPLLMPDMDYIFDSNNDPGNANYREIAQYKLSRFRRPHEVVLAMDGIQRPTGIVPSHIDGHRFSHG